MSKFIFSILIIPNLVLANNLCQSSFGTSDGDETIREPSRSTEIIPAERNERLSHSYFWLSTDHIITFQKIAKEEMGFTTEEVTRMLENELFMFNVVHFGKHGGFFRDDVRKMTQTVGGHYWSDLAIQTVPGLVVLKAILGSGGKKDDTNTNNNIVNNMGVYANWLHKEDQRVRRVMWLGIVPLSMLFSGLLISSVIIL